MSLCGNFQSKLEERGVEKGQTGTVGAAELAAECGVDQLFLVHMSTDLTAEREKALGEIGEIFEGETHITDEMSTYRLSEPRQHNSSRQSSDTGPAAHTYIVRH